MSLSRVQQAIVLTVAYCDQFEYPLTAAEVWQRCVLVTLSQERCEQELQSLVTQRLLELTDGVYSLPGRAGVISIRKNRTAVSQVKKQEAVNVARLISSLPWIRAVFLTGALAMDNADAQDDLDFMVVTARNRVWISRLLVAVYSRIVGRQRSRTQATAQSWCFNLWLSEAAVAVDPGARGVYQAYEVLQAVPLVDKDDVAATFLQSNAWVNQLLPNWHQSASSTKLRAKNLNKNSAAASILKHPTSHIQQTQLGRAWFTQLQTWLLNALDDWAWQLQWWYMKPHHSTEKVSRDWAFFHPRDTRKLIYTRWKCSLQRSLPQLDFGTIITNVTRS